MNKETEQFLNGFPDDIVKLAKAVCRFVSKNAADVEERVQPGWKVVTYRNDQVFCAVAPHKKWVNLQFYEGVSLPDPSNLLEGSGKSMRHVKIRTTSDLNSNVAALIKCSHSQNT